MRKLVFALAMIALLALAFRAGVKLGEKQVILQSEVWCFDDTCFLEYNGQIYDYE